ncbi:MAG: YscO family type III secretion system apparatus protein [Thermoproteota archaeon]
MGDIWYISTELEHVDKLRIILYKMDKAQEQARPNLGDILLWCRDSCKQLLKNLQEKKADAKDIEYVQKEITLLKEFEEKWRIEHKKMMEGRISHRPFLR